MNKKTFNIGLLICHLDNDYAFDICKGVDYAVKEIGANLIIFPGMYINATYNDPQRTCYDYQYNSIFYYANNQALDALIISIGTIGSFLTEADLKSFLANFKDIPLLTLETKIPGYPSLLIESRSGLREGLEHLIKVHNKRKIGFISGRKENADAVDRLNIYKEIVQEYNLPVDDSYIGYGDFSEFCEDAVGQLLDIHPDIDALYFANDQMALGGYNELKRRGYKIGTDIAVMGYDDVPVALSLDPPLSTARASAIELGYHSVYRVMDLVHNNGSFSEATLKSKLILRTSCGCCSSALNPLNFPDTFEIRQDTISELITALDEYLFSDYKNTFIEHDLLDAFHRIENTLLELIATDTISDSESYNLVAEQISNFINSRVSIYYSMANFSYSFTRFTQCILHMLSGEQKSHFCILSNALANYMVSCEASAHYKAVREHKLNIWTSSYIARDTSVNIRDEVYVFNMIMDKLQSLHFRSSYIYMYEDEHPVVQLANGSWQLPKNLLLHAYYDEQHMDVLDGDRQNLSPAHLFDHPYMPKNHNYTMVITPLFTNEDQLGLFVCEVEIEDYHHIYSSSLQLGTALKFLSLLKKQLATQQQLEYTLSVVHEKNRQLSEISTIDELTGLKNRRGFLDGVQAAITSPLNKQRQAILIFADMDNLKIVNDKFGHKDGDFALQTIARTLNSSMRGNDIIGRIGGDEFIAFAILDSHQSATIIHERILNNLEKFNATSSKPYYVDVSLGIVEFTCDPHVQLNSLIKEADAALYTNKRYKRASILKD